MSPAAQAWFDFGLNWTYAFNHEEAVHCFRAALAHDPDCAMAWWGIAWAAGPFYNRPWIRYAERETARSAVRVPRGGERGPPGASSGGERQA